MIKELAFRMFGNIVLPYLDYFDSLKLSLRKANMNISFHEYFALITFFSFISLIPSIIISSFVSASLIGSTAYAYTLAIIVSFGIAAGVFFFGYYYPSIQAKDVQMKIDRSLPFAVFYMTTTASSGINPVEIFRMLSLRGGVIGKEANKIYTNVKTLGMSLNGALQKSASKTPSTALADLFWGMSSVITSGGNLESYLLEKTRSFMNQYIRTLNDYAKQIALYTEIYITLIIVGTLFFIILIAIIAPLIGISILFLQAFLVFFFIPLISIAFIILLKTISPFD